MSSRMLTRSMVYYDHKKEVHVDCIRQQLLSPPYSMRTTSDSISNADTLLSPTTYLCCTHARTLYVHESN